MRQRWTTETAVRGRMVGAWLCAGGLAIAMAGPGAASVQVTFTLIEDLPGGLRQTTARAVSADGATVVGSSASASGLEAFRWTEATGTVGLGDLPGPDFSSNAFGISADGSTICGVSQSDGFRAWMWTDAGGMETLPSDGAFAYGASGDGGIVVGIAVTAGRLQAARWVHGDLQFIGALAPDSTISSARAVSADGSVIVGDSADAAGSVHACVWTAGEVRAISATRRSGVAYAVTADGTVVVGGAEDVLEARRAFRWSDSEGLVWLTPEIVGSRVAAYGVSADGSVIVGGASASAPDTAFVWTPAAGVRDLKELVEQRGAALPGWRLIRATGVSADGCTIVGYGQRIVDVNESFVIQFWRRADLNRNGVVDLFDFLEFQSLFAAGDPRADFNGDGVLDFFDFLAFQDATKEGCL